MTPHDVRDYDFADSPILSGGIVFGAGKAGRVIAWSRATGRRLWQTAVGTHLNDPGRCPGGRSPSVQDCYGGVETPMARGGRLFVPIVHLCMQGSATGYENLYRVDVAGRGTGAVDALDAATGRVLWSRHFPAPTSAARR